MKLNYKLTPIPYLTQTISNYKQNWKSKHENEPGEGVIQVGGLFD